MNRPAVSQAEMTRAIKVAAAAGLRLRECIVTPGQVRLIFADPGGGEPVDAAAQPGKTSGPRPWPKT
ncbi:MAG: hypothetical protein R8L07_03660 [Alphaproteobacteria bacterium]|nr:hypothetical protein [Alphaproteobacteria bacterium]